VTGLRSSLLHGVLLVAAVFALYFRTTGFGFSYVDDDRLIVENQAFLTSSGAVLEAFERPYFGAGASDHAYYRPLVTASFALDTWRAGNGAGAYHASNVIVHALAVVALLFLLRALEFRPGTAFFAALAFAVHPALTESVAWIPGRTDLLLGLFSLASLWCWVRAERTRSPALHGACVALWFCALLSKESAVVLPLLWAAERAFWQRRGLASLRAPRLWLGVIAALGAYLGLRWSALDGLGGEGFSLGNAFSNLPSLLGSLGKLVLPLEPSVLATAAGTPLLPGLAGVALIYVLFRLGEERRSELLFALIALGLSLAPGLPASGVLLLESRLYFSAALFVFFVAEAFDLLFHERSRPIVAAVVTILLAGKAYDYTGDFRDRRTFAEAAVRTSPELALAHRNLGIALHVQGDLDGAEAAYRTALARDETEPVVHNNLGVILMGRGDLFTAERHLRRELELNPGHAPAHDNLAKILNASGRAAEAATHLERAAVLQR